MKHNFKSVMALLLSVSILVSFTACGESEESKTTLGDLFAAVGNANGHGESSGESGSQAIGGENDISDIFYKTSVNMEELTWAGVQVYEGEAIELWRGMNGSEDMQKAQDFYAFDEKGNYQRIVSGASNDNTGKLFLTQEGYCLSVVDSSLMRIEKDGSEVYKVDAEGGIKSICQLKDGQLVLLMQNTSGLYFLALLDGETGAYERIGEDFLGNDNRLYISSSEEGLVLLNPEGFWNVNTETGELSTNMPISDFTFQVPLVMETFQMLGGGCVELFYRGTSTIMLPKNVDKYRTVVTVLGNSEDDWIIAQLDNFNKTHYEYYAKYETFSSPTSPVRSREEMWQALEDGEGADILLNSCFGADANAVYAIEKGYLEDIKPYMEQSGIYVEDYFPTTFELYRQQEGIYGVTLCMSTMGMYFKEEVFGGRDIKDMEDLVDALISYTEPAQMSGTPFYEQS